MTDAITTKDAGPRKALGRGLAALIPTAAMAVPTTPATQAQAAASTAASSGFRLLPIERIQPNKAQPRKTFDEGPLAELADSIREKGVLQPIIVRRRGDIYEIVAGERRWRAASRAGLHEIPALIKELSDMEVLEAALMRISSEKISIRWKRPSPTTDSFASTTLLKTR